MHDLQTYITDLLCPCAWWIYKNITSYKIYKNHIPTPQHPSTHPKTRTTPPSKQPRSPPSIRLSPCHLRCTQVANQSASPPWSSSLWHRVFVPRSSALDLGSCFYAVGLRFAPARSPSGSTVNSSRYYLDHPRQKVVV